MICKNCKSKNDADAKFCRICGANLKGSHNGQKRFFSVIFWFFFLIFIYSIITLIFPEHTYYYSEYENHCYHFQQDPLHILFHTPFYEKWIPIAIGSFAISIFSILRVRKLKKR